MITKFKIFENNKVYEDEADLAELFSQKFIEEYYKEKYEIHINDIIEYVDLWQYVDEEKVKDGIITDLIEDKDIDDNDIFKKQDLIDYIKDFMLELVSDEIGEYREKYEEYDLDDIEMLDVIAKKDILNKDLVNLIEDKNKEFDFKKEFFEDKYFNVDAKDILIDLHGKEKAEADLYDLIFHFIDDNEVIDEYLDRTNFEDKWEYFMGEIPYSPYLQKELLKIDKNTVLGLFNVMNNDSIMIDIGSTYNFQKLYIEVRYEQSKEDKEHTISQAIIELNEKFELNEKIKTEYNKYMYGVDSEKYNM